MSLAHLATHASTCLRALVVFHLGVRKEAWHAANPALNACSPSRALLHSLPAPPPPPKHPKAPSLTCCPPSLPPAPAAPQLTSPLDPNATLPEVPGMLLQADYNYVTATAQFQGDSPYASCAGEVQVRPLNPRP